jgi:hypothetical protein
MVTSTTVYGVIYIPRFIPLCAVSVLRVTTVYWNEFRNYVVHLVL